MSKSMISRRFSLAVVCCAVMLSAHADPMEMQTSSAVTVSGPQPPSEEVLRDPVKLRFWRLERVSEGVLPAAAVYATAADLDAEAERLFSRRDAYREAGRETQARACEDVGNWYQRLADMLTIHARTVEAASSVRMQQAEDLAAQRGQLANDMVEQRRQLRAVIAHPPEVMAKVMSRTADR